MKILFRVASYKVKEGWKPKFYTRKKSDEGFIEEDHFFNDKYFETKEGADKFASDYCMKLGYVPIKKG